MTAQQDPFYQQLDKIRQAYKSGYDDGYEQAMREIKGKDEGWQRQ